MISFKKFLIEQSSNNTQEPNVRRSVAITTQGGQILNEPGQPTRIKFQDLSQEAKDKYEAKRQRDIERSEQEGGRPIIGTDVSWEEHVKKQRQEIDDELMGIVSPTLYTTSRVNKIEVEKPWLDQVVSNLSNQIGDNISSKYDLTKDISLRVIEKLVSSLYSGFSNRTPGIVGIYKQFNKPYLDTEDRIANKGARNERNLGVRYQKTETPRQSLQKDAAHKDTQSYQDTEEYYQRYNEVRPNLRSDLLDPVLPNNYFRGRRSDKPDISDTGWLLFSPEEMERGVQISGKPDFNKPGANINLLSGQMFKSNLESKFKEHYGDEEGAKKYNEFIERSKAETVTAKIDPQNMSQFEAEKENSHQRWLQRLKDRQISNKFKWPF